MPKYFSFSTLMLMLIWLRVMSVLTEHTVADITKEEGRVGGTSDCFPLPPRVTSNQMQLSVGKKWRFEQREPCLHGEGQ